MRLGTANQRNQFMCNMVTSHIAMLTELLVTEISKILTLGGTVMQVLVTPMRQHTTAILGSSNPKLRHSNTRV